jgi:hypothetical protein
MRNETLYLNKSARRWIRLENGRRSTITLRTKSGASITRRVKYYESFGNFAVVAISYGGRTIKVLPDQELHDLPKRVARVKVYSFGQLSDKAKEVARSWWRDRQEYDYIWGEAKNTVDAFNDLFNLKHGLRSWLDFRHNLSDEVEELKGLRLRTYIINNYGWGLNKRKYMGHLKASKPVNHPCCRNRVYKTRSGGEIVSVSYLSRIQYTTDCVLTGVCYDHDILAPIYEFIKKPCKHTTLVDLFKDCFESLRLSIESEIEYRNSDEYVDEELVSNDYEFTEDGKRF